MNKKRIKSVCRAIRFQRFSIICVNDTGRITNWQAVAASVAKSFDRILPERCGFEKQEPEGDGEGFQDSQEVEPTWNTESAC